MRAFKVVDFGAPIVGRDLPDEERQAGEAIVDVVSCGRCQSDVRPHRGFWPSVGDGQGPFVMNTREQIQEAINDYQSGQMGRLA